MKDFPEKPAPGSRLPNETEKAFEAFIIYRDNMGFSIEDVSQELGRQGKHFTSSNLERFSSKYRWIERRREFQAHLDESRRAGIHEAIKEKAKEFAKLELDRLWMIYGVGVKEVARHAEEKTNLSPTDALKYAQEGAAGLRRLFGEADTVTEFRTAPPSTPDERIVLDTLRGMNDEELYKLRDQAASLLASLEKSSAKPAKKDRQRMPGKRKAGRPPKLG